MTTETRELIKWAVRELTSHGCRHRNVERLAALLEAEEESGADIRDYSKHRSDTVLAPEPEHEEGEPDPPDESERFIIDHEERLRKVEHEVKFALRERIEALEERVERIEAWPWEETNDNLEEEDNA